MLRLHRHHMSRRRRPTFETALLAYLCLATVVATRTTVAVENDMPSAEEVLDRYVAVTGGREAYDGIRNRVIHTTMEIARQGITLPITVYAAKPNLLYTVVESDLTGKIESGTDGNVVWENSLMRGPAIKSGPERSTTLRDATFDRLVYWKTVYQKAECVGRPTVNGGECFEIVLTPPPRGEAGEEQSAEPLTIYFAVDSGLATRIKSKVVTAAGTIPVEADLREYKRVGGILIAHKIVTKVLTQERIMTISDVEQNAELAADRFDLPPPIQALVNKQ